VALARALAKNAPLMLLDEPLVNLDYKLREELREELTAAVRRRRFHRGLCHHRAHRGPAAGRLHRGDGCGRAAAVRPDGRGVPPPEVIRVARAFSDPPMNLLAGELAEGLRPPGATLAVLSCRSGADACGDLGVRASACGCRPRPATWPCPAQVELAEISGSDTFVHADTPSASWWRS
jgi:glycerol transport system ATP-binding protein